MTQDYGDLFGVFSVDFDSPTESFKNTMANGVISGLDASVTQTNLIVTISAGSARVNGNKITFASAQTINFTGDIDSTLPKKALIVLDITGTLIKRLGLAAATEPASQVRRKTVTPDPPELIIGDIVLHEVWLSAGTTTILTADLSDRRITVADYAIPSTQAVGDIAAIGSDQKPAAGAHKHGMPIGIPVTIGTTNSAGAAGTFSDSAHIHQRSIEIQSSGSPIGIERILNFASGASVIDNPAQNRVDVTVAGGGHIIRDEGISLTQRANLNFIGTAVTATDNSITNSTDVLINPSGVAGYYGQRAIDYITVGDGSAANPYNASAIQSAINALPGRGGIVFIKSGVWSGATRITTGKSGNPTGRVILRGEGAQNTFNAFTPDSGATGKSNIGTHVICGFDVYLPTDFYDMILSPAPGQYATSPTIKIILDPVNANDNLYRWLGGFTIYGCEFFWGSPAIWMTGINMPQWIDTWQIWLASIERCYFTNGGTAIKIDRGDDTRTPQFFGDFKNINMNNRGSSSNTPAIDVTLQGTLVGTWNNILVEACGGNGTYAMSLDIGDGNEFSLNGAEFGDGSTSAKDAFLSFSVAGPSIRNFRFGGGLGKSIDVSGSGYYEIGHDSGTASRVNILNVTGGGGFVFRRLQGRDLILGSNPIPNKVLLLYGPLTKGLIGTTIPGSSPFTYTNNDSYNEMVYLVGGSITGITRNGTSVGTATSHFLAPGDSIVISYTSAPNIIRYGVS